MSRSNIARALFLVIVLSAAPLITHWTRRASPGILEAQQGAEQIFTGGMDAMYASGATAVVALEFGLSPGSPPQSWKGTVALSAGRVLGMWGTHFASPDQV